MQKKIVLIGFLLLCVWMSACNLTGKENKKTVGRVLTPEPTQMPEATSAPLQTPVPTDTPVPLPADFQAPKLTLLGEETMKVIARSEYVEPGYQAVDETDGDITEKVQITGEVNVNWCDSYSLVYEVSDNAGNVTTIERVVEVVQPETVVPEGKIIYLTFDDGPGPYTEPLLELLDKYQVKATFFFCGTSRSDLYQKVYAAGHAVGVHCKSHVYSEVYASDEAYFADLNAIMNMVYEATGVHTTMLRFPGGSSNRVSAEYTIGIMTRLTEQVTKMGYQYFDWNVSAGDSDTKDTKQILENMKTDILKHQYSIVLQHPENRKFSFEAVEELLVWGLENGYTFLPLDPTSPRCPHRIAN